MNKVKVKKMRAGKKRNIISWASDWYWKEKAKIHLSEYITGNQNFFGTFRYYVKFLECACVSF